MKKTTLIFLTLCLNAASLFAQSDDGEVLSLTSFLSVDKIKPGGSFKIGIEVTLNGKWHINSHNPSEEYLIPTRVTLDSISGVSFGEAHYPAGAEREFAFSETPLSVYDGKNLFWLNATAAGDLPAGSAKISGKFHYQACNDVSCLIPTNKPFEIDAVVAAAGETVTEINSERFTAGESGLGTLEGDRSDSGIADLISGRGMFMALVFIFLGGIALNLTPCVYPIIPITISFFVGQASGKMSKSFLLALIYVLGMSVTYSALGVTAALTGGLLGSSLQNPLVLIAIAGVFLVFAASMFGAFEIRVPQFLNNLAGGSRQGAIGSLVMGLTVGIVAAPCIGPFVLSLLTYVAAQGEAATGFLLFFILSLGLGLPYLILGTFSGSIKNLPRSGEWMIWVKKVFGVVMIAVAIYFINTLLPETIYVALLTLTFLIGGILVGFIDKSKAGFKSFKLVKIGVGLALAGVGAWFVVSTLIAANGPHIDWQPYSDELVAEARANHQPVIIDFYADWCIPCKQIDKTIFSQGSVVSASERFVALKADLTREQAENVIAVRKKYDVRGVPTVILLNESGREYRRFTDELVEIEPLAFVEIMKGAMAANAF